MAWLIGEMWLPLACLAGFATAWLWQRSALQPRIKSLEQELSLCRHRTAQIDKERKQALARIAPRDGAARARAEPSLVGHGRTARRNA